MRSFLTARASRLARDKKAMTSIEFALASASIAIVLSAALLAYGLEIKSSNQQMVAAVDPVDPDPIVTGSIDSKPAPATQTTPHACPDLPPVILRR